MKILQILILFTIINVIIGITNARASQVDQKAELADSESKKAAEAGIKLAALKEQQKATEGEEQSSLQNGKAVANDAKVSQIMQETKNRLAQESARN